MEIRRFGPGHRKPDGPPGTQGVTGQVILHDDRAVISELAFGRFAMITPHSNPTNSAVFIVISGAGYVQVGDERERVNHGEAVLWPADVPHGAYTDGTEMRAIVVELKGDRTLVIDAPTAIAGEAEDRPPALPATGALAERRVLRDEYDTTEGEPW